MNAWAVSLLCALQLIAVAMTTYALYCTYGWGGVTSIVIISLASGSLLASVHLRMDPPDR